ncbi:hypothetical protein [Desulfovibrio sp. ZJ200]|uniref:hypothetical protein n=1 Tax=Desulfovibrio sp. ZJ200 TaxID=2709792 RepID=UPI00197E107E|nr:hypothetical protein [Desulfovibrio sp. ZJ200]
MTIAESVIYCAFSVALPVSAFGILTDGRGTVTDSLGNSFSAMASGAHPQGDHGVHAGIVLNGQMSADIVQVGVAGSGRIAGSGAGDEARPRTPFPIRFRVFPINRSGQRKRLAAFASLGKQ